VQSTAVVSLSILTTCAEHNNSQPTNSNSVCTARQLSTKQYQHCPQVKLLVGNIAFKRTYNVLSGKLHSIYNVSSSSSSSSETL